MQETQVRSLGWEDSLEKEMATHPSILAWRMDRGARQATVHAVVRVRYNFKPPPTTTETMETGACGVKLKPTQTLTLLLCVALSKSYNLSNVLICRIRITVVLSQSCHEDKRRYFVLFSWQCLAACGILVPQSGIKPTPWQWKHGVLTTGPPGNSQDRFSNFIFSLYFLKLIFIGV